MADRSAVEEIREALTTAEPALRNGGAPLLALACRRALGRLAELPTPEAIAKREDEEAARWQQRIEEAIQAAGLTPIDASGNESGDPLDWTDDQARAALSDAERRGYERALEDAGRGLARIGTRSWLDYIAKLGEQERAPKPWSTDRAKGGS